MALNYNRMFSLPNSIKFITLVLTLLVLLCIGSAHVQPGGTGFIWASAVLSLIVDLLLVLLLMLELDQVVFPRGAFFSWPLLECTTSILFGITYFISIWLCANGSSKGSYAAFLFAGLFSLLNFSAYAFNVVIFGRIWANEYRVEVGGSRLTEDPEPPSYGGP
ncbi:hypothetical protein M3Y99_00700400 [Aphelenchoides fujianensis]|nr:hypothetical protein M3Y99_00700400 [Aphelenchoides fujianensis]